MSEHRERVAELAREVLQQCGITLSRTSELQRQAGSAYLYGMVYAYGRDQRLPPADIQSLAETVLTDVLHYPPEQATSFASQLVQATLAGAGNPLNGIIRCGLDAYGLVLSKNREALQAAVLGIFASLGDPYQ